MQTPAKSRLIVLHLTKFSDHGVVLHTLDSEAGRHSFLVRGLKRGGAVAAFHPLALLEAVSALSPKSTLAALREWEPAVVLPGIRSDRLKGAVAMFLSEVLYRSFTSESADRELFDWIWETVVSLDGERESVANFPAWFLVSYAVKLGFMPGETVEPAGLFPPEDAALFQRFLRTPYAEALCIPLSGSRRQAFARKMLQYLSWHLGTTIDAKSLDVLHAVLS